MNEITRNSAIAIAKKGYDFSAYDFWILVLREDPRAVVGASNDTPVLVVSPNHRRAENALITIEGVVGNPAANGTFRAKSVTQDAFLIFDPETGEPISGTDGQITYPIVMSDDQIVMDSLAVYCDGSYRSYVSGGICKRAPVSVRTVHWANVRSNAEGLVVGAGGIEEHEERHLLFFRPYLLEDGIPKIEPTMSFEFLGERWDLDIEHAIIVDTGPNMATNPTINVVVRKAVEREHTLPGSEFSYDMS